MSTIDQQFIEYIVKSIVGNPDSVEVSRTVDERGVLLELTVDAEDLGRVIGKRGSGAQALRTLLRALGTKNDARYNLKIVDTGEAPVTGNQVSDDGSDLKDEVTQTEASNESDQPEESSRTAQTRKELEDLDDLDI
jgi:hypothetical protein